MEYLADITLKAEPLVTGLAADIHGQVKSCIHKVFFFFF